MKAHLYLNGTNHATTNIAQILNDRSIDCVFGTQTRGSRMDESTELWGHPMKSHLILIVRRKW